MLILRVISGTAKSHKLKTLKGDNTRPTSDRVKESLFNIISGYIAGSDVLDLYSGTGSLAIEALSRGANSAVLVDKSRECFSIIKENLMHTKLSDKAQVMNDDAQSALRKLTSAGRKFDLIFLDPPYRRNLVVEALDTIVKNDMLNESGIIVAERDTSDDIPHKIGDLTLVRDQKYGDTVLAFYRICQTDIEEYI